MLGRYDQRWASERQTGISPAGGAGGGDQGKEDCCDATRRGIEASEDGPSMLASKSRLLCWNWKIISFQFTRDISGNTRDIE